MLIEEAEYATDIVETADIEAATGGLKYEFAITSHALITPAQRATLRTAALDGGWSALRTAWSGLDTRAGAWLDGLDANGQAALLRQVKRGPVPAP